MFSKIILIILVLCAFNTKAYAYIDPGVGSIVLQAIIGAIAATSLTIKIYWQKIKAFFKKRKNKELD